MQWEVTLGIEAIWKERATTEREVMLRTCLMGEIGVRARIASVMDTKTGIIVVMRSEGARYHPYNIM